MENKVIFLQLTEITKKYFFSIRSVKNIQTTFSFYSFSQIFRLLEASFYQLGVQIYLKLHEITMRFGETPKNYKQFFIVKSVKSGTDFQLHFF